MGRQQCRREDRAGRADWLAAIRAGIAVGRLSASRFDQAPVSLGTNPAVAEPADHVGVPLTQRGDAVHVHEAVAAARHADTGVDVGGRDHLETLVVGAVVADDETVRPCLRHAASLLSRAGRRASRPGRRVGRGTASPDAARPRSFGPRHVRAECWTRALDQLEVAEARSRHQSWSPERIFSMTATRPSSICERRFL